MRRTVALSLSLALLVQPACVKKRVKKALEKETTASLTVSGDAEVLLTLQQELPLLHKVAVTAETVEKGVMILRIVGAYAKVVDAIVWLVRQNLRLLANDEVTKAILAAALK